MLMFWWASCTSARHAASFDCLMTSLILITMDNGRGHCAYWQSCKVPNQTHRRMKKIRKMYAIKEIKICGEYRDMLPRPRLDLSGTPGLQPIGLSPGSWQISLGLGSMSWYSAQILICILRDYITRSTQKSPVRHKMAGSTQKYMIRHKNALPSMHQLPLRLPNTRLPLRNVFFPNFIQIFCFSEPIEKWKTKLIWYSNKYNIRVTYEM